MYAIRLWVGLTTKTSTLHCIMYVWLKLRPRFVASQITSNLTFVQQHAQANHKEDIKALHYFAGLTAASRIPLTKGKKCGNPFHVLPSPFVYGDAFCLIRTVPVRRKLGTGPYPISLKRKCRQDDCPARHAPVTAWTVIMATFPSLLLFCEMYCLIADAIDPRETVVIYFISI